MKLKRYSIYKHGYVNEDGSINDPKLFMSESKDRDVMERKFLFRCLERNEAFHEYFTCEEVFDGIYWVTVEGSEKEFSKDDFVVAFYFRIPGYYNEGLEYYPAKILNKGVEHSTCELYHWHTGKSRGVFYDICTADIKLISEILN